MPKRIQMRRTKGWKKPEDAVYVGRPTKWGNPWKPGNCTVIVLDESGALGHVQTRQATVAECVEAYRKDVMDGTIGIYRSDVKRELRGKDLACWCRLCELHRDGKPLGEDCLQCAECHADVLLAISNA